MAGNPDIRNTNHNVWSFVNQWLTTNHLKFTNII